VNFPAIAHELLWFIAGETNVRCLHERNAHIWDQWADADGELGPVYGKQWRSWPTANGGSVDQLADVVDAIKRDPDSRRHIVSAWNVADLDAMALPPCHCLFQFYSPKAGQLSRLCEVIAIEVRVPERVRELAELEPGCLRHHHG